MTPENKLTVLQAEAALATVLSSPGIMLWESDKRWLEAALEVLRDLAK